MVIYLLNLKGLSDPYVICKQNGVQFHKTKTHKKTLNPIFNETVQTPISSRSSNIVTFEIFDYNAVQKHVFLGQGSLHLRDLKPGEVTNLNLPISRNADKSDNGNLIFRIFFDPGEVEINSINMEKILAANQSSVGKFGKGLSSKVCNATKTVISNGTESVMNATRAAIAVGAGSVVNARNVKKSRSNLGSTELNNNKTQQDNVSEKRKKLSGLSNDIIADKSQQLGLNSTSNDNLVNNQITACPMISKIDLHENVQTTHPSEIMVDPKRQEDKIRIESCRIDNFDDLANKEEETEIRRKSSTSTTNAATKSLLSACESGENNSLFSRLTSKLKSTSRSSLGSSASLISENYLSVSISIMGAKELKNLESGSFPDPFVKVYHKSESSDLKSFYKTSVLKKTRNPVWTGQTFTEQIPRDAPFLQFEVLDHNAFGKNVKLGHVTVDIVKLLGDESEFDAWLEIEDGAGKLHLVGKMTLGLPNKVKNKSHIFSRAKVIEAKFTG